MIDLGLPQAGKPANLEWYASLLDEYDELVANGVKNPVRVMAQETSIPVGTIKSWLSRGRRYLERQTKPIAVGPHCRTCSCCFLAPPIA